MNPSDEKPKIPLWVFIVTDIGLLSLAGYIVANASRPLAQSTVVWTVVLALTGVFACLVPLVMYFERKKNEALDERQRELEALARTVASSAEQISIAAGGLHEIADLAQKNLRHADQLPHKLQEKVAELQASFTQAADAEKEELERELLALRTSESERLETVSQRIAKSAAEWAKLEAATQQHLTAANEAVAKLQLGTANAIGKAQAAAEQALAQARTEAARNLGEASGVALKALESAKTAALADLEAKVAAAIAAAAAQLVAKLETASRALDEKLARLESATALSVAPAAPESSISAAASAPTTTPPSEASPEATSTSTAATPAPSSPPKRPRKTRRDESVPEAEPATAAPHESPAPAAGTAPAPEPEPAIPSAVEEPAPIVPEKFTEITPVAPATSEPFSGHIAGQGTSEPAAPATTPAPEATTPAPAATTPAPASESDAPAAAPAPAVSPASEPEPARPARKRPAKKPEPAADDEPSLGLDLGDADSPQTAAATSILERVLSSDGATRLLVTAYIGIGNRLFIRGEGPGLSWEKGVPLQFISIGKWRWETNDADAPVQFKLYKNDDIECAALGTQTLEPGHQQEVTAAF